MSEKYDEKQLELLDKDMCIKVDINDKPIGKISKKECILHIF